MLRYLIGLLPFKLDSGFPIKTLTINVVDTSVISLVTAMTTKNKSINPQIVLILKVGACSGFTTFSTFAYETTNLFKSGNVILALGYVCFSVILGILAVLIVQMLVQ